MEPIAYFEHVDGALSELHIDNYSEHVNPRKDYGNVATLIQESTHCIDLDDDDAGLAEARDYFEQYGAPWEQYHYRGAPWETLAHKAARAQADYPADGAAYMVRRYLAMFRPDVLHYEHRWSAGESYGWGYVTRKAYEAVMLAPGQELARNHHGWWALSPDKPLPPCRLPSPAECFEQEVDTFRRWDNGEVYGVVTTFPEPCRVCHKPCRLAAPGGPLLAGDHDDAGAWSDDGAWYDPETCDDGGLHVTPGAAVESCWGLLGYDSEEDMVAQVHGAKIVASH